MKKAIVLCLITAFCVCMLASCTFAGSEPLPVPETKDEDGVWYTPLDIDLIYVGDDEYELQIGLYADSLMGASQRDIVELGETIGRKAGKTLSYIDYNSYPVEVVSTSDEGTKFETKELRYFSYALKGKVNFELTGRYFGFFNYHYDYKIVSEDFIGKLFAAAIASVKEATGKFGGYTVDDKATYASYDICTGTDLSAENATWVQKSLALEDYAYVDCLVFAEGADFDYSTIDAQLKVNMASGWFIVPIILGVITVVVLLLIKPKKEEQIFRVDTEDSDGK